MQIPSGYHLNSRSFSFEAWVNRDSTGEACLFSQGSSGLQSIYVGFDESDHFTMTIAGQTITSDEAFTDLENWHHYVVSYDHANQNATLIVDLEAVETDNAFFATYQDILEGHRFVYERFATEFAVLVFTHWEVVFRHLR